MIGRPGGPGPRTSLAALVAAIVGAAAQSAQPAGPPAPDAGGPGPGSTVLLDRITEEGRPPYCVHGETFCTVCGHAVWLGPWTYDAVVAGAAPLCLVCAMTHLPSDTPAPAGRLDDTDHPPIPKERP